MQAIFTDIAADKAGATEQRQVLQVLRNAVAAGKAADANSVEFINVSKVKRSGAPAKRTPVGQKQLSVLECEWIAANEDPCQGMVRQLRALPAAQTIVHARHLGIGKQLPITRQQLKFLQRNDLAIDTAMLTTFETLAPGMADLLQRAWVSTEVEACK